MKGTSFLLRQMLPWQLQCSSHLTVLSVVALLTSATVEWGVLLSGRPHVAVTSSLFSSCSLRRSEHSAVNLLHGKENSRHDTWNLELKEVWSHVDHVRDSSIWDSSIISAIWGTDAAPVIFWSMEDQVAQPWWEQPLEVGPLFLLGGNRGGFTVKLSANEWSWIKLTFSFGSASLCGLHV